MATPMFALRLDDDLRDRLEAIALRLSREGAGRVTVTDVARKALEGIAAANPVTAAEIEEARRLRDEGPDLSGLAMPAARPRKASGAPRAQRRRRDSHPHSGDTRGGGNTGKTGSEA